MTATVCLDLGAVSSAMGTERKCRGSLGTQERASGLARSGSPRAVSYERVTWKPDRSPTALSGSPGSAYPWLGGVRT
jgi:hypothetical protein